MRIKNAKETNQQAIINNANRMALAFPYLRKLVQQKEILIAISKEGKAKEITSSKFLKTYKLTASSVQGAIKGLLDKDFVTCELGEYSVYDKFFESWLRRV